VKWQAYLDLLQEQDRQAGMQQPLVKHVLDGEASGIKWRGYLELLQDATGEQQPLAKHVLDGEACDGTSVSRPAAGRDRGAATPGEACVKQQSMC
jgi:hypothetical protein